MDARIPDFFIVGHSKCGTTALYRMLREHPGIFMPELKEPRFFGGRHRPQTGDRSVLPSTLEEYMALFAPASPRQIAGEATPSYLRSETAARDIAAANPDARCIAIFREPANFVRAFHLHLQKHHIEPERDLRTALANEEQVRVGAMTRKYSDLVRYTEQLRRFHAVFPEKQILVLIYEEFRRDNEGTFREALRFLDVDDGVPFVAYEVNKAVRLRSFRLDDAVSHVYDGHGPVSARMRRGAKAVVPERMQRALGRIRHSVVYGKPPPPDETLMAELRARFRPEVVAIGDYLGRDLISFWGYD